MDKVDDQHAVIKYKECFEKYMIAEMSTITEEVDQFVEKMNKCVSMITEFEKQVKEFNEDPRLYEKISHSLVEYKRNNFYFIYELKLVVDRLSGFRNSLKTANINLKENFDSTTLKNEFDSFVQISQKLFDTSSQLLNMMDNETIKNFIQKLSTEKSDLMARILPSYRKEQHFDFDDSLLFLLMKKYIDQLNNGQSSATNEEANAPLKVKELIDQALVEERFLNHSVLQKKLDEQKEKLTLEFEQNLRIELKKIHSQHLKNMENIVQRATKLKKLIACSKSSFREKFELLEFNELVQKLMDGISLSSDASSKISVTSVLDDLLHHPVSVNLLPDLVSTVIKNLPEEALVNHLYTWKQLKREAQELLVLSKSLVFLEDRPLTLWTGLWSWVHSKLFVFLPQFYEWNGAISNYVDIAEQYDLLAQIQNDIQKCDDIEILMEHISQLRNMPHALFKDWMEQCSLSLKTWKLLTILQNAAKNRIIKEYRLGNSDGNSL